MLIKWPPELSFFNTLRLLQNGRCFTDEIYKYISLKETCSVLKLICFLTRFIWIFDEKQRKINLLLSQPESMYVSWYLRNRFNPAHVACNGHLIYLMEWSIAFYIDGFGYVIVYSTAIFQETISWLLMPWRRKKPGHQQPWYWLNAKSRFSKLFYRRQPVAKEDYFRRKIGSIRRLHYNDVIMGAIASQITSLTIVYLTVYSSADQRKTSKLGVTGDRWIPRTKGP